MCLCVCVHVYLCVYICAHVCIEDVCICIVYVPVYMCVYVCYPVCVYLVYTGFSCWVTLTEDLGLNLIMCYGYIFKSQLPFFRSAVIGSTVGSWPGLNALSRGCVMPKSYKCKDRHSLRD